MRAYCVAQKVLFVFLHLCSHFFFFVSFVKVNAIGLSKALCFVELLKYTHTHTYTHRPFDGIFFVRIKDEMRPQRISVEEMKIPTNFVLSCMTSSSSQSANRSMNSYKLTKKRVLVSHTKAIKSNRMTNRLCTYTSNQVPPASAIYCQFTFL